MKSLSISTLVLGIFGVIAFTLVVIGAPHDRVEAPPAASYTPAPPSVSANGVTLASTSVDLPVDQTQYPDGPHADVINANCTTCHSASMALNQPALTQDQWKGEVSKMVETYKAPIAAQDMPAIVAYLTAMSAKLPGAPTVSPAKGTAPGHGSDATAG